MNLFNYDPLFRTAAEFVVGEQKCVISQIQKTLKTGYPRTARIIDQLEQAGIVGPYSEGKHRIVLLKNISDLEEVLSKLLG